MGVANQQITECIFLWLHKYRACGLWYVARSGTRLNPGVGKWMQEKQNNQGDHKVDRVALPNRWSW